MAGVNIIIADTDEEAERLFTSLIRMFFGVLTGNSQPLHPPTEMTDDLKDIIKHPSLHQMLKYSFVGSKEKIKRELLDFIDQTNMDELMTVSTIFDIEDRLKSIHLFAELMDEINLDRK